MARTSDPVHAPYNPRALRSEGADGQWLHDKAPRVVRAINRTAARPTNANSITNTRIKVSNLHYEVTESDLNQIFGQIGTLVREPQIRYDLSGRSLGSAIVTFEKLEEATRAKKQFDGILCKDQPMSIEYDTSPPLGPKGARRGKASLFNRIEKPPLLDRIEFKSQHTDPAQGGVGPVRTKARRGAASVRPPKAKPKTAEELDKELDAFMQVEVTATPSVPIAVTADGGDVEMA